MEGKQTKHQLDKTELLKCFHIAVFINKQITFAYTFTKQENCTLSLGNLI